MLLKDLTLHKKPDTHNVPWTGPEASHELIQSHASDMN